MILSLILAVSENGVIGDSHSPHQELPWRLPDDLRHFRERTRGKPVIMGRKTHQAIGFVLPERLNIVISRQLGYRPMDGAVRAGSIDEALAIARSRQPDEAFIIGGAEIFRQALALADRIELTRVHAETAGDVFFRELDLSQWTLVSGVDHPADERHEYAFTFETWERRR